MQSSAFFVVWLASILFLVSITNGQNRPLERFAFEDGDYTLVGVFEHHSDHPVQKKVGEFYTDDITVLNAIRQAWNFPRKQNMYACGYHYYIALLHNGEKVDDLLINLECNEIVTDQGSRYFDSSLLLRFAPRLKHLSSKTSSFGSIEEARLYWDQIKREKEFVFAYEPEWLKYEGRFQFQTSCPDNDRDCYFTGHDKEILLAVRRKIETAYPNEKFELRSNGGTSNGDIFFEIQCNGSLESKFDIYDRWGKKYSGKWQPYPLHLSSFWKRSQKL